MNRTQHGGDIYSFIEKYGTEPLDFSANINPLGLPECVKKTLHSIDEAGAVYPDPHCSKLKLAISQFEGVPPEYIFCSNGAADIIYRIAHAMKPTRALITAPTFSEYETALKSAGCETAYYLLHKENDFRLTEDILEAIKNVDIVFICNPNNPTGQVTDKKMMLKIAEKCAKTNTILVVDECFNDFLETPDDFTVKNELERLLHVILLKAFTKIFAMAGLRLGYCISSSREYLDKIIAAGQPWNVSTPAQLCGIAALQDIAYLKQTKALIKKEREFLINELKQLGFEVYGSMANYIFFNAVDMPELDEALLKKGILIRSCENYYGLCKGYFRVAVKDENANKKLIAAIKQVKEEK
jgi:L-threonine-O-3-phosphate decarboxylase